MKVQIKTATPAQLNWLATYFETIQRPSGPVKPWVREDVLAGDHADPYTTDYHWGGPLLDKEGILCGPSPFPGGEWAAVVGNEWDAGTASLGESRLIAGVRCYLERHLGEVAEVPDKLAWAGEGHSAPTWFLRCGTWRLTFPWS